MSVILYTRDGHYHIIPSKLLQGWLFFTHLQEEGFMTDIVPIPLYEYQFTIWLDLILRIESQYIYTKYMDSVHFVPPSPLIQQDVEVIVDIMNPTEDEWKKVCVPREYYGTEDWYTCVGKVIKTAIYGDESCPQLDLLGMSRARTLFLDLYKLYREISNEQGRMKKRILVIFGIIYCDYIREIYVKNMNWTSISWNEIVRMKCSHIIDHVCIPRGLSMRWDDTNTCNTTSQSVLSLCNVDGYNGERPTLNENMYRDASYTINSGLWSITPELTVTNGSPLTEELRDLYCRMMRYHLALLEDGCSPDIVKRYTDYIDLSSTISEKSLLAGRSVKTHLLYPAYIHMRLRGNGWIPLSDPVEIMGKEAYNLFILMNKSVLWKRLEMVDRRTAKNDQQERFIEEYIEMIAKQ